MDRVINELKKYSRVYLNSPLAEHTSFRTGGNASILAEPSDEKGAFQTYIAAVQSDADTLVVGGGTNLLISDKGFPGIVIKISDKKFMPEIFDDYIYSSSFVSKENFIESVLHAGFGGVEFMAGIPGSIGGGIFMNAGTFMGCFSDVLFRIKIADSGGNIREIDIDPEDSGYRKMNLPEECVILGGYFKLPRAENIDSVKTCIKSTVDERWIKHPMEYPSAGSVFKNPEGHSAWKLVNDCGLKGYKMGGAMVSEKHTNFIINTGDATSQNIYDLIKYVQRTVYEKAGVNLETEVKITGDFN